VNPDDPPPNSEPVHNTDPCPAKVDPDATQYLVREASGDPSSPAWDGLAAKIERFLTRRYQRHTLPVDYEVEDVVMEVMLRVLRDLSTYRQTEGRTFWAWLSRVAEHVLIDLKRRESTLKRGGQLVTLHEDDEHLRLDQLHDADATTPTVYARRRELEQAEMECANRLSKEARSVYLLRRREELPFEQIAELLGRSHVGSMRSTFKRARDQVKDCLTIRMNLMGEEWNGWRVGED